MWFSGRQKRLVDYASCAGWAGKLPQQGTAQVVRDLPGFQDPNLIVGPEGFSDAGVYRLRDDLLLVLSLDFFPPLVDDPFVFGQIAAANSLSDIYAMGAEPRTALNIVGFPDDKLDLSVLSEILRGGAERVAAAGAVVAGGHTVRDREIKFGLSVTGVVHPDHLMTNRGARPGDALVLTKALGTGFVTTAFKAGRCPEASLASAVASMTALNSAGCRAARQVGARAATDITGFGLAGHASELAQSSAVTVILETDRLPVLPHAERLIAARNRTRASATNRAFVEPMMHIEKRLDPRLEELLFDAQTSGGLLISVAADRAAELVSLAQAGGATAARVIGEVVSQREATIVIR